MATTGAVRHTFLAGAEFGLQGTDHFRQTGFFNNTATSVLAPFSAPTISTLVTFRQNAPDADNHLYTRVAAAYVQDQVELFSHLQIVGGLRSIASTSPTTTTATATSYNAWTNSTHRASVSSSSR